MSQFCDGTIMRLCETQSETHLTHNVKYHRHTGNIKDYLGNTILFSHSLASCMHTGTDTMYILSNTYTSSPFPPFAVLKSCKLWTTFFSGPAVHYFTKGIEKAEPNISPVQAWKVHRAYLFTVLLKKSTVI